MADKTPHILVADDDATIREVVGEALTRAGMTASSYETLAGLMDAVKAGKGDVVISDVVMPDADGIEAMEKIASLRPRLPVLIMSAKNTLSTAVRASREGAFEYLPKPFDLNDLVKTVRKALKAGGSTKPAPDFDEETPLVGRSRAMQAVYRTMARVMETDLPVLIEGESGTGKELVAQALHDLGRRAGGPFVALNMAAIPKDLIESELFGHEKGAFTGADTRFTGRFEEAAGGTLFLDEIGDMPAEAQTRLLRVLQQGEFRPVGSRQARAVDVRIIAATNRPLAKQVDEGSFREDLFYRLNVVPLELPPLRRRKGDIAELVARFLKEAQAEGLPAKRFDKSALKALQQHHWPGNVRELRNLVRRMAALTAEDVITDANIVDQLGDDALKKKKKAPKNKDVGDNLAHAVEYHLTRYFEAHPGSLPPNGLHGRLMREVERPLIVQCLRATRGNQLQAADLLGINRNTLRKKLKDLKIDPRRL